MKIKKKNLLLAGFVFTVGVIGYKVSFPAQAKASPTQEKSLQLKALNLPLEPGPENNKTKMGIDSNNNGLRDDVEIHIANRYGEDKDKMQKIMEFAKVKQSVFNIWRDSEFCLSKKLGISVEDAIPINNDLVSQVFNNFDRQVHYQDVIIKSEQFGTEITDPICVFS